VLYRALDVAGNLEPERRVAFEIVDDQAPPTVSVSADPYILWPPNHRLVPVTITIEAADLESGLQAIAVSVVDEYDQHEPLIAPIELAGDEGWVLQLVVELLSDRLGSDLDGRTYDILVQVQDMAGNITLATATVRVPHDQRR
jgi:hypothetical protein